MGEPKIEARAESPYVGIRRDVTPDTFRDVVDEGFPALFAELGERAPSGAPFIRFVEFAGDGTPSVIEIGAPVAEGGTSTLPAGDYATFLHVGPFRHDSAPDLADAREQLLAWGREQGIEWEPGYALERYLTDPSQEPDFMKWETELAYLTRP